MKTWTRYGALGPGLAALLGLAACGDTGAYKGPAPQVLPMHIQRIGMRPFKNRTQFFGLEDRLRLRVEQEFIRDGRLPYVSDAAQSDGILDGEIANYIKQVTVYDANNQPLEYRLWVIINVRFTDLKEQRALWEEPRMEGEYRYTVDTQPGGLTEEEARDRLWDLFARDVVKRTIDGFGSVTGASEKKVPESTVPSQEPTATAPAPRPRTAPPPPY